ncbi:MAG: endonuclease domain-containing protein [Gammaproteobacteria bacterium]|nr:MAG: endonuclease domain-containing protein [Gammaproteobacteria bacterium]
MRETTVKDPLSHREYPQGIKRVRERGSKLLLSLARILRRQASDAENLLWNHLRGRRLNGYKFRRQVVIEPNIVDFICLEAKLIIEADGGQHAEQMSYDNDRASQLERMGYKVLRFWNHEILNELQSVLEKIALVVDKTPSPQPSPGGRGGL